MFTDYSTEQLYAYLKSVAEAEKDLYSYTQQAWPIIYPHLPFKPGKHIEGLARHLEAIKDRHIKRFICNLMPRSIKSIMIDIIFPTWVWATEPWSKFLLIFNGGGALQDTAVSAGQIIASPWYQSRWGHKVKIVGNNNNIHACQNTAGGKRVSRTIFSKNIIGTGGDYVIVDDPNAADRADGKKSSHLSLSDSEKVAQIFFKGISSRLEDKERSVIMLVQQRLSGARDLTQAILDADSQKEWVQYSLPAEFDGRVCVTVPLQYENGIAIGEPWKDWRTEPGELLWPQGCDHKTLSKMKSDYGNDPYLIASQLQQNPLPEGGGILQSADFKLWPHKELPDIWHKIISWDTGLESQVKHAYTACTVWGLFTDENFIVNVILLNSWRKRMEFEEIRDTVKRTSQDYRLTDDDKSVPNAKYRPDVVMIEGLASGKPVIQSLRRAGISNVHEFQPAKYGSKIERVHLIKHVIKSGIIWVPTTGLHNDLPSPQASAFLHACDRFPEPETRDLIDTMTQALLHLNTEGKLLNPKDPEPNKRTYNLYSGYSNTYR